VKRRSVGLVAASLFSLGVSSGQGNVSTFFNTSSSGLAIDAQGNVYLTESSTARVRKISSGVLSTIAGNGNFGYAGDGGQAINATLSLGTGGLSGLAVDSSGNVYFSDSANHVIRKINTPGVISTYAGNGAGAGAGFGGFAGDDGPATSAKLDSPTDIAIDSNGNLYICDTANSRVRKVTPGGAITTFAGNGNVVYSGDGVQAATTAVPSPG
jgi:sugar lactone lactonase YvrE